MYKRQSGDIARYRLEFRTRQSDIRGLKIEALPDDALPKKGPGRSANGNFVLSEVRVRTSVGRNSRAVEVVGASASFSQVGWPAEASIDGREHGMGRVGSHRKSQRTGPRVRRGAR